MELLMFSGTIDEANEDIRHGLNSAAKAIEELAKLDFTKEDDVNHLFREIQALHGYLHMNAVAAMDVLKTATANKTEEAPSSEDAA